MRVNYLDPEETAVRTSLIDFGLSRLRKDGRATATPLPAECYDGVGEQWDVYRAMRALIAGEGERAVPTAAWDSFYPRTNVLWLHYLARRLLHFTKTLRKPVVRRGRGSATTKKAQKKDPVRERCDAAYAMLIMVESEILAEPVRRGRKSQGFASAEDVMAWGRVQGWVA
jgi:serine/threonine-protein kinase haspin